MDAITTLSPVDAAKYQGAFDAVMANNATQAQLDEVNAVITGLQHYLRDAGAALALQLRGRAALVEGFDTERRARVLTALDGNAPTKPAIKWDNEVKSLVTADNEAEVITEKARLQTERDEAEVARIAEVQRQEAARIERQEQAAKLLKPAEAESK